MAIRNKYLTEFKARLCSVMASSLAEIADLVHRLPRERKLEASSYTSYSDKEVKNIAHSHRHKIYLEISSQTFKRHFPLMKKIDEFKCSEFAKIVIFMIALGFDNNEIANYLIADKQTIGSTRSKRKKEISQLLLP